IAWRSWWRGKERAGLENLAKKQGGGAVGESKPGPGELKALRIPAAQALRLQASHVLPPFDAEVVAGGVLKENEGPAGVHAQTEGRDFTGRGERWECLLRFNGAPAEFELLAIQARVGPVFGANPPHIARRTGPKPMVSTAAPVVDVVAAGESRDGLL